MHVCMFTDSFLPYCSGVTFSVLNQAIELSNRGHRVSIFRPNPGRLRTDENIVLPNSVRLYDVPFAVSVNKVPKLRITLPSLVSSFFRVRKLKPDVVHLSTEWGCGWEGLIASKLLRLPTVGTFHTFFADPGYLKSFGLPRFQLIQSIMWRYSVFFYNSCKTVTSPSNAVKQSLLDHGFKWDPIVIPNGIEQPPRVEFRHLRKRRRELGITGPSFIYFGRISPEKSLDILVRAFAKVVKRRRRAKLIIVGNGPSEEGLRVLSRELGIEHSLIFLGYVPHEQLIQQNIPLLADTFVTSSKTENQPMSILEAMSFGLPIVGPAAKGIPELVTHERNGLLFETDNIDDMANQMIAMANRPKMRLRMGRAALATASNFMMNRVVDRLEQVYVQAITRKKGAPPPDTPTPHEASAA